MDAALTLKQEVFQSWSGNLRTYQDNYASRSGLEMLQRMIRRIRMLNSSM